MSARSRSSVSVVAAVAILLLAGSQPATGLPPKVGSPDPGQAGESALVVQSLSDFFGALDLARTDPAARTADVAQLSASTRQAARVAASPAAAAEAMTSATSDVIAFNEASLTITASVTTVGTVTPVQGAGGEATVVDAEVTTVVRSAMPDGTSLESSWTDIHRLTLTPDTGTYRVADDTVLPPTPEPRASRGRGLPGSPTGTTGSPAATTEAAAVVTAAGQPALNTTAFKSYALLWTSLTNVNRMNPDYPTFTNNCANFASQTLRAGGWQLKGGVNPRDTNNWHYNLTGPAGASDTWVQARTLYYYARTVQGWAKYSSVWSAKTGDLIFVDWDPNGRADGTIDHVMVVSGHVTGVYAGYPNMPLISQKSNNRSNIPLTQSINLAKQAGVTLMTWYALQHK